MLQKQHKKRLNEKTGAHYKRNVAFKGKKRKHYVELLKHHLKTLARKLKLMQMVFKNGNDSNHTLKVVVMWLKDNNVSVIKWLSKNSLQFY